MTFTQEVRIDETACSLSGTLTMPAEARGLILFAHGSGSSRKSPRNQYVANQLNQIQMGTLLFDLLTPNEEKIDALDGRYRFDIELLSKRLIEAIDWAIKDFPTLPIGLFGASTGAAAALVAAAERPNEVSAVVSRGGRPDLANSYLNRVFAPTLLIVGEKDREVIALNQSAMTQIRGEKRLILVPNATHLFEEPGALDNVARHAARWFDIFLKSKRQQE